MSLVTIKKQHFEVCNGQDPYWKWVEQGCYDHEWNYYDAYLKPEHTFVDLGAWVGAHSLYASTLANKIIAVEPDPIAAEILGKNIELNPIDGSNRTVFKLAVGIDGIVTLGSGCLGASTTRRNLSAGDNIGPALVTMEVQGVSLRTLLEAVPDPLFIKMDIEGMEEDCFKDVAFFHERKPTLWLEKHPWWWENKAQCDKNFQQIADKYKTVENPLGGYFYLSN
jgi:FkbM family methyltransferase